MDILEADLLKREADKKKMKAKAIAEQSVRGPAALMDSSDGAGQLSRDQERAQFFKSNPVMQRMKLDQEMQGLPPDQIPVIDAQVPRADDPRAIENAMEIAGVSPSSKNTSPQAIERIAQEVPENVLSRAARLPQAQTQQSPSFDNKGLKIMNQGFKMLEDGIVMEAGAQAAQLENEAKVLETKAQEIESINNSAKEQQEAIAANQREVFDKAIKFNEQMKSKQIDTDRFWNSRDTGQKAMLTLGIFLMGVGGRDGLAQLNNLIDRDIAAQKEAFDRGMNANDNMVSIMAKLYGDETAAIAGAKAMALENLMAKLESKMASTKSAEVRARVPKLVGAMKIEQGKLLNDVAVEMMKAQASSKGANKIGTEAVRTISLTTEGKQAIDDIVQAFRKMGGSRWERFNKIGDNDYTESVNRFIETLPRLNTGAVINAGEEKLFRALVPGPLDSKPVAERKLRKMQTLMNRRVSLIEQSFDIDLGGMTGKTDSRVRIVE